MVTGIQTRIQGFRKRAEALSAALGFALKGDEAVRHPIRSGRHSYTIEPLEDRTLMALTVTSYNPSTPTSTLTDALVVPSTGITVASASYIGANGQGGTFSGFALSSGSTSLSLADGVLLTSGSAVGALGPNVNRPDTTSNDQSVIVGTDGAANLDTLVGEQTFDANVLTLTFTTAADTRSIIFDFVFGSEEFPDFVGGFNDAFGAYLDGTQISFDSNNRPITVNNNFFLLNNSGLTTSDTSVVNGTTSVDFNIEYDGLTPHIRTQAPLNTALTTHTLTFAIADTGDDVLDSGIFLSRLQGSTQVVGTPGTDIAKPGTLQFSQPTYAVGEAGALITLTVTRTDGSAGAITVDYSTGDASATAGADYSPSAGTILLADTETSKSFTIPILEDATAEGDETFTVTLNNPTSGVVLGAGNVAAVVINDNDSSIQFSAPTYTATEKDGSVAITVTRLGTLAEATSVSYTTSDGTAIAGTDYRPVSGTLNFAAGEASKTITVRVIRDFETEGTETISVNLGTPTGSVQLGSQSSAVLSVTNEVRPLSIVSMHLLSGAKKKISAITISFNGDLDPGLAQDKANYEVFAVKEKRLTGVPSRQRVVLRSVVYDAAARTITLTPTKALKTNQFYEVDVHSREDGRIASPIGEKLDGNLDDITGDDSASYVALGNKLTFFDRDGDNVSLKLASTGGGMEVVRGITRNAVQINLIGTTSADILSGKIARPLAGSNGSTMLDSITGALVNNTLAEPQFTFS